MPEIVKNPPAPGSPEWRSMITASKVPAILGVSRFKSQYTLWHEMAGNITPDQMNEDRAAWGHYAEESLAKWWLTKHDGWALNRRRAGTYEIAYTDPNLPFPNMATLDRRASRGAWRCILECKTSASFDGWGRPGEENSIPMDYTSQVLFQMGVSGIHRAEVVLLGPSMTPEIHPVEWDPELFAGIVARCEEWAASLESGVPPELDNTESTYETVRGLHPDIDRDAVVQCSPDIAARIIGAERARAQADAASREAKITASDLMGSARLLMCDDVKIADRRVRQGGTPYVQINKKAELEPARHDHQ